MQTCMTRDTLTILCETSWNRRGYCQFEALHSFAKDVTVYHSICHFWHRMKICNMQRGVFVLKMKTTTKLWLKLKLLKLLLQLKPLIKTLLITFFYIFFWVLFSIFQNIKSHKMLRITILKMYVMKTKKLNGKV